MSHMRDVVDLPMSYEALRRKDFESVLEAEVLDNQAEFPLEVGCDCGGWPDPETIECEVEEIRRGEDGITEAEVRIRFVEVTSTGCSDVNFRTNGYVDVVIRFDGAGAQASWKLVSFSHSERD